MGQDNKSNVNTKIQYAEELNKVIFATFAGVSLLFLFEIGEPPFSFARLIALYCFTTSLILSSITFMIFLEVIKTKKETTYLFSLPKACKTKFEKFFEELMFTLIGALSLICFMAGIIAWLWDLHSGVALLAIILIIIGVYYFLFFVSKITDRFTKEFKENTMDQSKPKNDSE